MKHSVLMFLILIFLTACGNRAPSIKQYFRLNPEIESTEKMTTQHNQRESVLITRPKTLGILGGRPMVATTSNGALVQLNNHYWLESPTVLFQQNLVDWADNHWQQVQTNAAYDAQLDRLDTTLLAFEKDGQQAKVSIQFILHNSRGEILLNQTWHQTQAIAGDNYADFVTSMNQATAIILQKLSQAIEQL